MPRCLDGPHNIIEYFGKQGVDLTKTSICFIEEEEYSEPPDLDALLEAFNLAVENDWPFLLIYRYNKYFIYEINHQDPRQLFDKIKNDLFTEYFVEQHIRIKI